MAKNNFLLINLNDQKTKKLAETITSDTSRKILDYLATKEDTETSIANTLSIPLPTVHYHLQKLKEAGLVVIEEFHYSQKGREVSHYKLANKYIIIAPKDSPGLMDKLKNILPVVLISLGIGVGIRIIQYFSQNTSEMAKAAELAATDTAEVAFMRTVPYYPQQPDIALWFLLGSVVTILLFVIIELIRNKTRK